MLLQVTYSAKIFVAFCALEHALVVAGLLGTDALLLGPALASGLRGRVLGEDAVKAVLRHRRVG